MNLIEFLSARIAEDEADAHRIAGAAPQFASRLRAECAAKRRIMQVYQDERARRDIYESPEARVCEDDEQRTSRRSSAARCRGLEIAAESLAEVYADHPDYRTEWAPDA